MEIKNEKDAIEFIKSLKELPVAISIKSVRDACKDQDAKKLILVTPGYVDFLKQKDVQRVIFSKKFKQMVDGPLEEFEIFVQKIPRQ